MSFYTAIDNKTASFAATRLCIPAGGREIVHIGVYSRVTTAALAGVLICTIRWTDNGVAHALVTPTVALTSTVAMPAAYAFVRDNNTELTVEGTIVGLLGTVEFAIFACGDMGGV